MDNDLSPSDGLYADWKCEKIIEQFKAFESELDNNSEIALKFASFNSDTLFYVTAIKYQNPDLIYFYGYIGDKPAQLVQHVCQLNFLITSAPKVDSHKSPRRIGFLPQNAEE